LVVRTVEDVYAIKPSKENGGYQGPTFYRVPGYENHPDHGKKGFLVAPWNHPTSIVNIILAWIQHTIVYGVYVVAPMGHGKTTIIQTLVHYLHMKGLEGIIIHNKLKTWDFKIVWAGKYEFQHQQEFFERLEKRRPHIIIFDDISGALKEISEQEMEKNFSTLTTVREIIDPGVKRTPVIFFVAGHYSKNLEKEFRAQLGMSIYCSFGNEERTNLDTLAEKGSDAYRTLKDFGDTYHMQYTKHKFCLYLGNGKPLWYNTDEPFRCAAVISKTGGQLVLFTDKDICEKCMKRTYRRIVPALTVYEKVVQAYGNDGIAMLQQSLFRKGYTQALTKDRARAGLFIDRQIDPYLEYDAYDMLKIIWEKKHKAIPTRINMQHKKNSTIISELYKASSLVEMPTTPLQNFKEREVDEPENHNDLFFTDVSKSETITNTKYDNESET
jgi:hypothetical protein